MILRTTLALPLALLVLLTVLAETRTSGGRPPASDATPPARTGRAATNPFKRREPPPPVIGAWDLTVTTASGEEKPSWIEMKMSGNRTLVGRYVAVSGSARPVSLVTFADDTRKFRFTVPPQFERTFSDIVVEGILSADANSLEGTITDVDGKPQQFSGRRAPALKREAEVSWGEETKLFNGTDLGGWHARWEQKPNGWKVIDGVLTNEKPGNDLVTDALYDDFRLAAEFRYPKKSNSGIYLRGRYEVQIEDTAGREPDSHHCGGVYGFLLPNADAAKPAGEWQTMEITLVGRTVSVTLNGKKIIQEQLIPGPTGGALDSDEGKPGPVMIQGDHGPIEFRKLTIIRG